MDGGVYVPTMQVIGVPEFDLFFTIVSVFGLMGLSARILYIAARRA